MHLRPSTIGPAHIIAGLVLWGSTFPGAPLFTTELIPGTVLVRITLVKTVWWAPPHVCGWASLVIYICNKCLRSSSLLSRVMTKRVCHMRTTKTQISWWLHNFISLFFFFCYVGLWLRSNARTAFSCWVAMTTT